MCDNLENPTENFKIVTPMFIFVLSPDSFQEILKMAKDCCQPRSIQVIVTTPESSTIT